MPLRRSQVDALDVIAYTAGIATLDLRVSSGTYVRSIADALGGHCVSLRRTEVGPFSVEEADAERVLSLDESLGRIGMTVAEAEAERQRKAQSDRRAHEERKAREAEPEQRQAHGAGTDTTETGIQETDAEAGAAARGQAVAEERGAVGG